MGCCNCILKNKMLMHVVLTTMLHTNIAAILFLVDSWSFELGLRAWLHQIASTLHDGLYVTFHISCHSTVAQGMVQEDSALIVTSFILHFAALATLFLPIQGTEHKRSKNWSYIPNPLKGLAWLGGWKCTRVCGLFRISMLISQGCVISW